MNGKNLRQIYLGVLQTVSFFVCDYIEWYIDYESDANTLQDLYVKTPNETYKALAS